MEVDYLDSQIGDSIHFLYEREIVLTVLGQYWVKVNVQYTGL